MLTSLANLKAYLGITVTTDDTLLTALITRESARIEAWLSRTLASTSYSRVFNGNGGRLLLLPDYPVTAVSSLTIDGVTVPASSGVDVAGYVFNNDAIFLRDYRFMKGVQNVAVSYTAGYETTPLDVEQSCIELAALSYKNRERLGLSSKGLAGETTSFITDAMPKHIEGRLHPYRRVVL